MNFSLFEPVVVTTTSSDRNVLESISTALVEQRLAACVQLSGPIFSCYSWEGKIENTEEWRCEIKSSRPCLEAIEKSILSLHNYEQPEIVVVDIIAGSEPYLKWISESVNEPVDES